MILYKKNNLIYVETRSDHPNSDWTGKAEYIVNDYDPNNQELISKIFEYVPYMDYVLDDNGNLIDVIKTQDKPVYVPKPSAIEVLQEQNNILKAKVTALTESNQFLEECLVEMAEIVYA